MITLITGSLGTGKTALAVKLLSESEFYPGSAFVFGVRNWKGAGTFYPLKTQDKAKENQDLLEASGRVSHSCYLIDEVKKVWPTRVAGRDAPGFIDQHLAESRSVSQDWILTAQAPGQLDVSVRRLVGRHIHLTKTPLGTRYSEAGECRDDLKFDASESRKYDFPVESLSLYDSDEGVTTHQKKGLKIPTKLVWLLVVVAAMIGVVFWAWNASSMFGGAAEAESAGAIGKPLSSLGQPGQVAGGVDVVPLTKAPNKFYYLPRNPEFPELAKASRLPLSCLASASKCSCYDQAGQLIEDMGEKRCRDIVAGRNPLAVMYPDASKGSYRSASQTKQTPAPRSGNEATAPEGGLSRAPSGPVPPIPRPPPAVEAPA